MFAIAAGIMVLVYWRQGVLVVYYAVVSGVVPRMIYSMSDKINVASPYSYSGVGVIHVVSGTCAVLPNG